MPEKFDVHDFYHRALNSEKGIRKFLCDELRAVKALKNLDALSDLTLNNFHVIHGDEPMLNISYSATITPKIYDDFDRFKKALLKKGVKESQYFLMSSNDWSSDYKTELTPKAKMPRIYLHNNSVCIELYIEDTSPQRVVKVHEFPLPD
jgi:MoaA/NifB/PqqE/SkfB family radical SAM enzyme